MKNLFYILIILLTLSSCESFEDEGKKLNNEEIYSSDFQKFEIQKNFEVINLDSISDFKELRNQMGKLTCEEKITGMKFTYNDKKYYLTGFAECPTFGGVACYFRRNTIIIKNDSIITGSYNDKKISIEKLEHELNEIISKPINYQYNKEILKPALIYLYIDKEEDISITKKVLKEIIEQFQKVNSNQKTNFFEFNILFKSFDISNITPPPPPPVTE